MRSESRLRCRKRPSNMATRNGVSRAALALQPGGTVTVIRWGQRPRPAEPSSGMLGCPENERPAGPRRTCLVMPGSCLPYPQRVPDSAIPNVHQPVTSLPPKDPRPVTQSASRPPARRWRWAHCRPPPASRPWAALGCAFQVSLPLPNRVTSSFDPPRLLISIWHFSLRDILLVLEGGTSKSFRLTSK